jgi:hypothetical protein
MDKRKEIKEYLDRKGMMYISSHDRAYIIRTDTLSSEVITKLVSLGVYTFISVNNRGLQNIMIEY